MSAASRPTPIRHQGHWYGGVRGKRRERKEPARWRRSQKPSETAILALQRRRIPRRRRGMPSSCSSALFWVISGASGSGYPNENVKLMEECILYLLLMGLGPSLFNPTHSLTHSPFHLNQNHYLLLPNPNLLLYSLLVIRTLLNKYCSTNY